MEKSVGGLLSSRRFDADAVAMEQAMHSRVHVPKFKGTDWLGWSKTMRTYLIYHGLWDVVRNPVQGIGSAKSVIDIDDDDPFGDSDTVMSSEVGFKPSPLQSKLSERACLEILSALGTDELMSLVYDVPDNNAYALWHRLESFFEKRNQASVSQLMTEFHGLKQRSHEAIELYVGRIRKVVISLQQCTGRKQDRATVVFRFLNGLTPMFDQARAALEARDDIDSLTFEKASSYMIGQASNIAM